MSEKDTTRKRRARQRTLTPEQIAEVKRKRRANRMLPVPSGKHTHLDERALLWSEKMQNGTLSLPYLHAYSEHLVSKKSENYKSEKYAGYYLTDLFHEYPNTYLDGENIGGQFFSRPSWQERTKDPRGNYLLYDNTKRAEALLSDAGRRLPLNPGNGSSTPHNYFVSCIYSSIEIATLNDPTLRFIHQQEIMDRAGLTSLRTVAPFNDPFTGKPVKVWSKKHKKLVDPCLLMDAICGLERTHPDGTKSYLYFPIEACKGTEGLTVKNDFSRKSFLRNYLQYKQFLATGAYKKFFKVSKVPALTLYITAKEHRVEAMQEVILEHSPKGCPFMLFQYVEGFDVTVKPPNVLQHLFDAPWYRAGHNDYYISNI